MEQVRRTRIGSPTGFRLSRWLLIAIIALAAMIPGAQTGSASPRFEIPDGCPIGGGIPMWYGTVSATDEYGVTLSGLVPGQQYTLETTGGSWTAQWWGGQVYYHGFVTNGMNPNWYRMAFGTTDYQDVGWHWPAWVEQTGSYYRMYWTAQTTSIRFRVADAPGKFYDNSGFLNLTLFSGYNYCNIH
ncbi:MAG TPA: hypothetical protein VFS21_33540 [Roseiflexaceae bacterium]|nr:hypothetical protein [Roseiflexaceae bacterium]